MRKRYKMSPKKSRKLFKRTANHVNALNIHTHQTRGGIRLQLIGQDVTPAHHFYILFEGKIFYVLFASASSLVFLCS